MAQPFSYEDASKPFSYDEATGVAPPTALGDKGRALKSGLQQLPGMLTGLADIPTALAIGGQKGWASRPFTTAAEKLGDITGFTPGKWAKDTQYSDAHTGGADAIGETWKGSDAVLNDPKASKGDYARKLLADAPAIGAAYLQNPNYTADTVLQSVPSMVAGGVASKAMMLAGRAGGVGTGLLERKLGEDAASTVAGAAGEGTVQAGQAMDTTEATDQRKNAIAAIGSGVGDALIAGVAGSAAHHMGLETAGTAMAKAGDGTAQHAGKLAARVAAGATNEALLQEFPQSMQEQAWQNWAEGKPLGEGVARQGVEGAIAGGVMGAAANARGPGAAPAPAGPPPVVVNPNAGPTSRAAAMLALPAPGAPLPVPPSGSVMQVGPDGQANLMPTDPNAVAPVPPVPPAAPVAPPPAGPVSRAAAHVQPEQPPEQPPLQPEQPPEQAPAQPPAQPLLTYNDVAAHQAAVSPHNDRPEPTKGQILGGNAPLGHMKVGPLDISIETPSSVFREDKHNEPPQWRTQMQGAHYGYIKRTVAADSTEAKKQGVDVFVKEGTDTDWNGPVFVIDQVDPKTGHFDEHKGIIGVNSQAEAEQLYHQHYEAGWQGMGAVTAFPSVGDFNRWVKTGRKADPANPNVPTKESHAPQSTGPVDRPAAPDTAGVPDAAAAPGHVAVGAGGTAGQDSAGAVPGPGPGGELLRHQPAAGQPADTLNTLQGDSHGTGPDAAAAAGGRAAQGERGADRAQPAGVPSEATGPLGNEGGAPNGEPAGAAPKPLSIGRTPTSTEPVTIKNGIVHIGRSEAINFDSGEPVTVPEGATHAQIKQAIRDAGALGNKQRFFGGDQDVTKSTAAAPVSPVPAPAPVAAAPEEVTNTEPAAQRFGKDGTDLSVQGAKPFKTKLGAIQWQKQNHPQGRVVKHDGGFAVVQRSDKELEAQQANGKRRQKAARVAAIEKNPFMVFLADHGLFHVKGDPRSLKSEFSPDRAIMVGGVGPVFRANGKQLDVLAAQAAQDGFLPPGSDDATALEALVHRAIRGERIAPMYAEGEAEKAMADHEAQHESHYDDFDGSDFSPADLGFVPDDFDTPEVAALDPAKRNQLNALLALAAARGIDTEAILEDAAHHTSEQPEDAYLAAAINALQQALDGSAESSSVGAGQESSAGTSSSTSAPEVARPAPSAEPKSNVIADGKAKKQAEASTAPEHAQVGVDDRELDEIVDEFKGAVDASHDGDQLITRVFDAPAKGDIVRLADKVKVYHAEHGWMTVKQAQAKIAEWKAHTAAQADVRTGQMKPNSERVVLSLFDLTGSWSDPWVEAGYQVYRFDIQDESTYTDEDGNEQRIGDVTNFSTEFFNDIFGSFDGNDVHAILAATPCTDFAVSGARHFAAKDADGRTVASVKLVHMTRATVEHFKPAVWAIENPVGRIERLGNLPPWRLSFDPFHMGDTYTKKTMLWGRFNADLPIAPVDPVEGSKMHQQFGGKSLKTKNARSATPEGFAYGFFMANNAIDHPVQAIANKYDRLDRDLIKQALDAKLTEQEIESAVDEHYYMDLDDEAANQALRDAIKAKTAAASKEGPKAEVPTPAEPPVNAIAAGKAKKSAAAADFTLKQDPGTYNAMADTLGAEFGLERAPAPSSSPGAKPAKTGSWAIAPKEGQRISLTAHSEGVTLINAERGGNGGIENKNFKDIALARAKLAEWLAAPGAKAATQGAIGMKLSAGQVVLTTSGRETSPFPKISLDSNRKAQNTVRAVDRWLIDNALAEAQARGDDFNARQFQSASKPSQADKDSAEEYLFGEQPAVVPSILKPLSPAAPAQAPPVAPAAPAEAPPDFNGLKVKIPVELADGTKDTMTVDAGKAIAALDARKQALEKLKLCIGGAA